LQNSTLGAGQDEAAGEGGVGQASVLTGIPVRRVAYGKLSALP